MRNHLPLSVVFSALLRAACLGYAGPALAPDARDTLGSRCAVPKDTSTGRLQR